MKFNRFPDMIHQLIKRPALGENINTYPPTTPEAAIRIDFKFDEHENSEFIYHSSKE